MNYLYTTDCPTRVIKVTTIQDMLQLGIIENPNNATIEVDTKMEYDDEL